MENQNEYPGMPIADFEKLAKNNLPAISNQQTLEQERIIRNKKIILLEQWVDGDSIHIVIDGHSTCAPDMSCCCPELLAPLPFRQLYLDCFINNDDQMRAELSDTFTLYFAEANGFSTSVEARLYTDWIKETDLFGWFARFVIWCHKRNYKIKY